MAMKRSTSQTLDVHMIVTTARTLAVKLAIERMKVGQWWKIHHKQTHKRDRKL